MAYAEVKWRMAVCALACLLVSAGCGGGEPNAGSSAPDTAREEAAEATTESGKTRADEPDEQAATDADAARSWTRCTNEAHGYSVEYPEGWSTTQLRAQDRCRWFDRDPFDLEQGTEPPLTDLVVRATIGTFEQAVEQSKNPYGERTLARQGMKIDGNQAVQFEKELTEDLLYPAGTKTYGYVVDHHGTAVWIETRDPPDVDVPYAENKEVVDHAATTLVLHDP